MNLGLQREVMYWLWNVWEPLPWLMMVKLTGKWLSLMSMILLLLNLTILKMWSKWCLVSWTQQENGSGSHNWFLVMVQFWWIFFRIYKIPDGKPENKFAFDGEFQDAEFANKIISETHEYWKQLVGMPFIEDYIVKSL